MNSRIDLLSKVIENKVNVLSDQCKNFEMLLDNIKFLQMELKTNNEIINNLIRYEACNSWVTIFCKTANSQIASLAKQQIKEQDTPELPRTELAQPTSESLQKHQ